MCTCRDLLLRQIFAEEGPDSAPAIHRLLGPIQRAVPVEEAVAGAVVAVELIALALLFEFRLVLVNLLRARGAVIVAEQAEDRAAQILRHVERRDGLFRVELFLGHHHTAAPLLDDRVDVLLLAGVDEGMSAARAGTNQADLAVVALL